MIRPPPRSTRSYTPFPYPTLFRSYVADIARDVVLDVRYGGEELKAGQEIPKGSRINLILGNGMGDSEVLVPNVVGLRSEEHTSELQSLMRISYAVFCLKKKKHNEIYYNEKVKTTTTTHKL